VIKWTLILQGVPSAKFGRVKKRPKFRANMTKLALAL